LEEEVNAALETFGQVQDIGWYLAIRKIARAADKRTFIVTALPNSAAGDSVLMLGSSSSRHQLFLLGVFNSFVFDFTARQKLGGINVGFYNIKQFPMLSTNKGTIYEMVERRVSDLLADNVAIAQVLGEELRGGSNQQREELIAELNGIVAIAYGLTREDLSYVLDTFSIVDAEESSRIGEYRTKRRCLEAYDRFAEMDLWT